MTSQKCAAPPAHLEIVKSPWTPAAKRQALEQEVLGHYSEYFRRAMTTRNWSPWQDFSLEEMRQFGDRLGEETSNLIEGFLGVEEYVADYVLAGTELFRHNRTRRNMQLQWGAEEARHGVAWELVLQHSGMRTEAQLQTYLGKVQESRWDVEQHPGLDTPLGSAAYAMVQERATYYNYQEMRARIREEYGLTPTQTLQERERGHEIGASEAFRVVGQDEITHHGLFLKIVQSYIKYFPSLAFETLNKVFLGFEMPALRVIPNARRYLRAVLRTKIYNAEIHREKVHNPVLQALGLEDNDAFEKAVQSASQLPDDLGPGGITLSRAGEWVVGYKQPEAAAGS